MLNFIVRPGGLEPPTFGTGIQRSVQLNYGRKIYIVKITKMLHTVKQTYYYKSNVGENKQE